MEAEKTQPIMIKENNESLEALRAENAKLRCELRTAWTTELRMVEKARDLAKALSRTQSTGERPSLPSSLGSSTDTLDLRGDRNAGSLFAPRSTPVRRRTVDGAPVQSPQQGHSTTNRDGNERPARSNVLRRKYTKPSILFNLDKTNGDMELRASPNFSPKKKRRTASNTSRPRQLSSSSSDENRTSSSGSSSSTSSESESGTDSDTDTDSSLSTQIAKGQSIMQKISSSSKGQSPILIKSKIERKNGMVHLVSSGANSPGSPEGAEYGLHSSRSPDSSWTIQEHAAKLIELLSADEAPINGLKGDLSTSLQQLVQQCASQVTSPVSPDKSIPRRSSLLSPALMVSIHSSIAEEESSNSLPEKEVESTTSTQQQTTVQTNQIADASTHRVPDEIEVFNQRQVARLVSPFARAIEAKSDATAFQRRLRAMSLSTNSTNGSEPNKPNTRSSISKSRSRTRLASDSYVGYSSDSEVTSHSPSINRSEKPLSALAAEKAGSQTSSSSWYGSLKRRSRRSNSDLQNTAEEPTVKLGASTPSESLNTPQSDSITPPNSLPNGKQPMKRANFLDLPPGDDALPSPRIDRKKATRRSFTRSKDRLSNTTPCSPEDNVFSATLESGSLISVRSEMENPAKRSNSLRTRRSSAGLVSIPQIDRTPVEHLKVLSAASTVESPRASPATSKRFHFFSINRQRRRTESIDHDGTSADPQPARLSEDLDGIFIPNACKHPLKYLADGSLHWFHVVPCYDTWPVNGCDLQLPVRCDHYHHRHNKPHDQMEECCSTQPECSQYSYCSAEAWKFQLSLWELLRSEVVYLIEAILVLQDVHATVLTKLQNKGHLVDVDTRKIFGNVLDLVALSEQFSHDMLTLFTYQQANQPVSLADLIKVLNKFVVSFHAPYQEYGTNYHKSMPYIDKLLRRKDFQQFAKFCDQHPRVRKRSLKSFLFEPVQRLQRLPMLLKNLVQDYHGDRSSAQYSELSSAAKAIEVSCHELDSHVKRFLQQQQCEELQASIQWPTIHAINSSCVLPESAEKLLSLAPLVLTCDGRWLVHHGPLKLLENLGGSGAGSRYSSVVVFLFNDMLLVTRHRPVPSGHKPAREFISESAKNVATGSPLLGHAAHFPGGKSSMEYYVCKEPYPMNQIEVLDIPSGQDKTAKFTFCVMLKNSLFQYVTGLTLEAGSEKSKGDWIHQLETTHRLCTQ